jgi:hypothetical protein
MLMSAWKIMESVNMSAIIHQDRTTVDAVTNITWVKMEEAALISTSVWRTMVDVHINALTPMDLIIVNVMMVIS